MKSGLVKGIWLSALATVLGISLLSGVATADCINGTKDCRNGYWWICDKCGDGSENCWKYTGKKCELSRLEILPAEQVSNGRFEGQSEWFAWLDVPDE